MLDNNMLVGWLKSEIKKQGKLNLTVHGNSMFPTLQDGDIVSFKKSTNYNIGDIVAYYFISESGIVQIVIHRVIFKRKTYVLTKGDNNSFIDPMKILNEYIIGVKENDIGN